METIKAKSLDEIREQIQEAIGSAVLIETKPASFKVYDLGERKFIGYVNVIEEIKKEFSFEFKLK